MTEEEQNKVPEELREVAQGAAQNEIQPEITIEGGVLKLMGTTHEDVLTVSRVGSRVVASITVKRSGSVVNTASRVFQASEVQQVVIRGLDGNDLLSNLTDRPGDLQGGAGNDTLYGGDGADTLSGGDGTDLVSGAAGNDLVKGGAGVDLLTGGSGNDRIEGGQGDDWIYGMQGDDVLIGGPGRDVLVDREGDNIKKQD